MRIYAVRREAIRHLPGIQNLEIPAFMLLSFLRGEYHGTCASSKLLEKMDIDYLDLMKSFEAAMRSVSYFQILSSPNSMYMLLGDEVPGETRQQHGWKY